MPAFYSIVYTTLHRGVKVFIPRTTEGHSSNEQFPGIVRAVVHELNAHWVRALLVGRVGAPPISVLNFHEACSSKLDAVHSPQACALIVLSLLLIANQTIFTIRF